MRGLNLKPSRVYQTASQLLETESIKQPPPWFSTIGAIPPAEILTRTQPVQHQAAKRRTKGVRKPSKMFKPQSIGYEEDKLRLEFFGDHPWELARPRVVLENDGRDGQKCDWSRIQQPGRPLNGESVILRQLWLMNNAHMTKNQAYDIARKEFYALRHQEEVERKVQQEEALWTGAYFGKSAIEIGMELEDKSYESWKKWATKEVETMNLQRDSVYTGVGTAQEEEGDELPGMLEEDGEEQPPPLV